jgi:hypothetical protein
MSGVDEAGTTLQREVTMHVIRTYQEAEAFLADGPASQLLARTSRKVANNTYVERLAEDIIVVRLHDTAIVSYFPDGSIMLRAGGWYTQTTAERINGHTPQDLRLNSDRGRWVVHYFTYSPETGADWHEPMCFDEGITFERDANGRWQVKSGGLSDPLRKMQDIHNAKITKLITAYVKEYGAFDARLGVAPVTTDCVMCVRPVNHTTTVGDQLGSTQHLINHLINREWVVGLVQAAVYDAGYARMGVGLDAERRALRDYFRQRLITGPVATKGGRRPLGTTAWRVVLRVDHETRKAKKEADA